MIVKTAIGDLVNLAVGDRVAPVGTTRDRITYGYVRAITEDWGAENLEQARVYWPEIGECGSGWRAHDLIRLSTSKG